MDLTLAFQIAMTLVSFLGGWLLKTLFERIGGLEKADKDMAEQMSKLREDLPINYVRRNDFKDSLDSIFDALRRIEDKMERKVDKP